MATGENIRRVESPSSFGRTVGPAPGLGADTETVLAKMLDLPPTEIAALRAAGALG